MNSGFMPRDAGSDDWETPPEIFNWLDGTYNFNLDPCASYTTHKCEGWFGIEQDGLSQDWRLGWGGEEPARAFVNPPYSDIEPWVNKAYRESLRGTSSVLLLPARTDVRWWHVYERCATSIRLLPGRIKFLVEGKPQGSPRFGSAIWVFTPPYPGLQLERDSSLDCRRGKPRLQLSRGPVSSLG